MPGRSARRRRRLAIRVLALTHLLGALPSRRALTRTVADDDRRERRDPAGRLRATSAACLPRATTG
ncbi:hypothetical protein [Nocardia tenerifensis]|uniref:hypothetical protein n=1 Tax=Nocardia tenerifensis TaxID=228006 RepID=UPI000309229D|nr:hypothetical protein [Nocardia tenerifensis]